MIDVEFRGFLDQHDPRLEVTLDELITTDQQLADVMAYLRGFFAELASRPRSDLDNVIHIHIEITLR